MAWVNFKIELIETTNNASHLIAVQTWGKQIRHFKTRCQNGSAIMLHVANSVKLVLCQNHAICIRAEWLSAYLFAAKILLAYIILQMCILQICFGLIHCIQCLLQPEITRQFSDAKFIYVLQHLIFLAVALSLSVQEGFLVDRKK
jgi:hypothetical protein